MKRWLACIAFVLLFALHARAQGGNIGNSAGTIVISSSGRPAAGVNVSVCTSAGTVGTNTTPCSPLATIYSDQALTQPLSQSPPLTTDGLGNYPVMWAPPGIYQVQIWGPTVNVRMFVVSVACVPGAGACGTSLASLLASNNTFTGTNLHTAASVRTFANPSLGTFATTTPYEFVDNSPDSTNGGAQGSAHFLPYLSINLQATGTGTPLPGYFGVDGRSSTASNTVSTSDLAGLFSYCTLGFGARNSGCWPYNSVVALNAGYAISSIARSANVVTATLSPAAGFPNPAALVNGDNILVQGVTDTSYNSVGTFVITGGGGTNTITWNQTGGNSSSSGGTVTLDSNLFASEANYFNNIGDPGALGASDALPSRAKWGVVSTSSGTYPIMAAFLSSESNDSNGTNGNRPYNGFLCQDAITSCFTAGFVRNAGPARQATYGFLAPNLATAPTSGTANSPSMKYGFFDNWGNGSVAALFSSYIQLIPTPNSTTPTHRLAFVFNGGECCSFDNLGNLNGNIQLTGNDKFTTLASLTANPAATGQFRLASADLINWRNNANGADIGLAHNPSDQLTYNSQVVSDGSHSNTLTISSGTAAMTTALIASGACGATVTVSASGVATTDAIATSFNAAPGANPGVLIVQDWPTANNVNFEYCNPTAAGVTPSAATLNWRVTR